MVYYASLKIISILLFMLGLMGFVVLRVLSFITGDLSIVISYDIFALTAMGLSFVIHFIGFVLLLLSD